MCYGSCKYEHQDGECHVRIMMNPPKDAACYYDEEPERPLVELSDDDTSEPSGPYDIHNHEALSAAYR